MARPTPTLATFSARPVCLAWLVLLALGAGPVPAQPPARSELVSLDRIVAVVDDDPIFYSDLVRARALGKTGEGQEDLRPWLEKLIEERLRAHDIDRYGVPPAPPAEIEAQVARLEESRGGATELDAELAALGSGRDELRRRIGLQLRILTYIDERLAPRVFVDDTEVFTYYEGELRTRLLAAGEAPPPLEQVQNEIRLVLREQKLNQEAAKWTESLGRRARLVDLLERPESSENELPPVVLRLEEKRPPPSR